jgi:uncharacterized protein YjiS (DUF1127 family)
VKTTSSASPTRRAVALQRWASELIGYLKRWQSVFRTWRRQRAAINELSSLSDRQLKDIGLHRSEIMRAVRDRVPPKRTFSRYY